jgi:hypothetical protein
MHGTLVTHGNFVAMRVAPAMPKGDFCNRHATTTSREKFVV